MLAVVCVIDDTIKPVAAPQAGGAPITKSALEISKKILPTASTLMRHVVLNDEGIVITSDPSLAVAAAKTVGNVFPPSVDNKIFTLAQLTGAAVVLFTLQVTVADEPASQVIFVLGDVTWKGPEVLVTVTTTSAKEVCPTATGATELYG